MSILHDNDFRVVKDICSEGMLHLFPPEETSKQGSLGSSSPVYGKQFSNTTPVFTI